MTGKFDDVIAWLTITLEGKSYGPGSGVDCRIFDTGFVLNRVGIDRRIALHHVKSLRSEVAHHVKPCLTVEIRRINNESVAFPSPDGVSLPQLDRRGQMLSSFRTDVAVRMLRHI